VTTPLAGTNTVNVSDANNIAISTDTTLAFVTVNYLPSGTACAALPTTCSTLSILNLPATPVAASPTIATTLNTFGLRAGGVTVDPRGNNVYTATRSQDATTVYITVTAATAAGTFVTYIPSGAGTTTAGTNVCSNGGVPEGLVVSPDGNRLFIACLDITHSPQTTNTVDVWNVSGTGAPTLATSVALPIAEDATTNPAATTAENGCETPVDIKARLTNDGTTSTYGTRLFVSCQDSDTVVPIDYNTTTDVNNVNAVISMDSTSIANAAAPPYVNACGNGGSCPQLLDLMVNPALHFTSGGYAPAGAVALANATSGTPYATFVVAQGGTVVDSTGAIKRSWSNPDGLLGAGNCAGLAITAATGEISGTPTAASGSTCGPFVIRTTDASVLAATPQGQFVERSFTIAIH